MSVRGVISIGVVGTPGCGKTTLCESLDIPTITVRDLAEEKECLGEISSDGVAEVDVQKLAKLWENPSELTLYDGHLAHHLPVDALIVVRCKPDELKARLEARGYAAKKVQDNVEVEMLGGPWNDLIGDQRPIFEGEGVEEWIMEGCKHHTTPDLAIDWLSAP
tara:strand:- start:130 stop:618 length:489 start_codon:yes stop_codon:yes gene_type:complete